MKYAILLFALLFWGTSLFGQELKIQGHLIDENKRDLVAATIHCYSNDTLLVIGGVTNSKGEFELKLPRTEQKYKLLISYLGYKETTLVLNPTKETQIRLGEITMDKKVVQIQEVTVLAQNRINTEDKIMVTICTLVVTLASCNNENDVPEVPQKIGNVFMKLNLGQKADTRANEAPLAAGTTATVNSLHIYFYSNGDQSIQKYLRVDNTTTPSITDLTTGAQISDVPTVADRVLVRGNVPAGVSLPTSGLITTVENQEIEITTQNSSNNILLDHLAASIQTYAAGGGAAPIVGMQNGDKYAEIELEPAVARIEIEGLQARGTVIDAF